MLINIKQELEKAGCVVLLNENMSRHTTLKTGGNANVFCKCPDISSAESAYKYLYRNNIPFFVTGASSNLLISDKGYQGVILKFFGDNYIVDFGGGNIEASGGANCYNVIKYALSKGYIGGEFAATIPGSVGGHIVNNAGCYNREMKDIVLSCECLIEGKKYLLDGKECCFSYRKSFFSGKKCIILKARFKFIQGDKQVGLNELKRLQLLRRQTQPIEPSAGSIFLRKEGVIPAKLIDEAGLKGLKYGSAEVSKKHSGFIVNTGGACSQDVFLLIGKIKKIINKKYAILLEEEVLYIGEF